MKAYLISVGDEILIGQIVNTNAAYIADKLNEVSVDVVKMVAIGDNEKEIIKELNVAFSQADLVVMTGGLGPTHDDVTKISVAKFFDTEIVFNETVWERVKEYLEKRDIEVKEIHKTQAEVPEGAEIFENAKGTAPGLWLERDGKYLAVMPGVPAEMKAMTDDYLIPRLRLMTDLSGETVLRKTLLTTGLPESEVFLKLGNLDELLDGAQLAFLPNQFGVRLRITVKAPTRDEANDKLLLIEQKIRAKIGRYIYGSDNQTLEEVVAKLLIERELTLATAESCTGGLIASRLTNIPGSSAFFDRGIVSYSNGAKVELLNVDEDTINTYGAVSPQVAEQMATGVRQSCGADLGLAVTGIMGPGGATATKPVGLVYIALADEENCTVKEFHFGDDRLINKDKTAQRALDMLRRYLLGISDE